MTLTDKTALISGAAGAIGAAVARSLLAMGARVILLDRAAGPLADLTQSLGDRAVSVVRDLTDEAGLRAAVAGLVERFGRIDVLVNNAGILTPIKAAATSMQQWRRVMAINLDAAFILTASLPAVRSPEGYLETIPELVVEVRSKNDTNPEIAAKNDEYFQAGVVEVWVIDPNPRTVAVCRVNQSVTVFDDIDTLTSVLLPGWGVLVANLFVGS